MRKLKLSGSSELRRTLRREVYRSQDNHFLHRLHCMLLISEGCSCREVAAWFGENCRTIERWVHRLQDSGVDGLKDVESPGRPAKLNVSQQKKLLIDLAKPPWTYGYRRSTWSGKLLASYIGRKYSIELSERQCQRFLKKAGAPT